MTRRHLKRMSAPRSWPISRKTTKWITRPNPGPHSLEKSMSFDLIIKELIGSAKTSREVKRILNEGKILVNNLMRKDRKFPVGIMDVISIPSTSQYFRLLFNNRGKFILHKINKSESHIKINKVTGKKVLKGKKLQINLDDGWNKLVDKDTYKVGDSVLYDLDTKKITDHIKLEKGSHIYLTDGKHIGAIGVVEKVLTFKGTHPSKVVFRIGNHTFETLKDYVLVIGKDKPLISLSKENE